MPSNNINHDKYNVKKFKLHLDGSLFELVAREKSGYWEAPCPFDPDCGVSLVIDENINCWRCLNCGKEGLLTTGELVSSREMIIDGLPRLEWLVEGLIPQRCVSMITAPFASYKTWVAMFLSKCVSEGLPFLGRKVKKTTSIYVDRENPPAVIVERLKVIGPSDNWLFYPLWKSPPLINDISKYKSLPEGSFVVFDSLQRFHALSENDSSDMAKVMGSFRELAIERGMTVLIIHHQGKEWREGFRGSSEIAASVDVAFAFERVEKGSNVITIRNIKHRFSIESDITVKVHITDTEFELEDITGKECDKELQELRTIIEDFISSHGRLPKQGNVIDEAIRRGFSKNQAFDLLRLGEGRFWEVKGTSPKFYQPIY